MRLKFFIIIFTPKLISGEYIVFYLFAKPLFWTCCFRLAESTYSVHLEKSVPENSYLPVKTASRLVLPVPRYLKKTLSVSK